MINIAIDYKCLEKFYVLLISSFFSISASFSIGRLFVSMYGQVQASIVLLKHLIDPAQFVLFWWALLMNQIWSEYFTVRQKFIDID